MNQAGSDQSGEPTDWNDFLRAVAAETQALTEKFIRHSAAMPAARFVTHSLWSEARWSGTTYSWHPQSESPPIMGLVFDNVLAAVEIFREAERMMKHVDRFDEIRISIIEGIVAGQEHRPGYSIHLSADPDALAGHATMEGFVVDQRLVPFLGQWNQHYPILGTPSLLAKFKEEFQKHREFMLAPAVPRPDGRLGIEPRLGIIKKKILFRLLSEITEPDDLDASAQVLPRFIVPP